MRGKNKNSIASCLKLPQFTITNVINGQAGIVIYASLILYSLTTDNILNVIVLIILAAVSISLVLGEHGLLKMARDGRDNYLVAANEEQAQLGQLADQWESLINGGSTKQPGEEENGSVTIELSIAGTKVNATTPPNPDPNIFEHTEGTIDTGYVIRDKNNGNEFVWVPVEADQKITLKATSTNEDITSIKLYDPLGEEISLGSVSGKSYNNTNITPTINGGYKAEVTTASGTETKTLVVRSLYAKDTFAIECMDDEYFLSDAWKTRVKTYYGGTDIDDATLYQRMGVTTDEQFLTTSKQRHYTYGNYTDGATTYANSVNTNGGFYIARYEAGATTARTSGNSSETVDAIKTVNGVPTSTADQTPYNYITQDQAKGLAESMYTGASFTCTLPTGAAWDRTLGWLVNTSNKSLNGVATNSSNWGNYCDVGFSVSSTAKYSTNSGGSYAPVSGSYTKPATGVLLTTGAAPARNVSNNIFDLAGNVYEWTTEVSGSDLVIRGGNFYVSGSSGPSSIRNDGGYATDAYYDVGFRPALYL